MHLCNERGHSPPAATGRLMDVDGRRLILSDSDAPAWPDATLSKAELLNYYLGVADDLLVFLRGRPSSVVRLHEGLAPWVFDRSGGTGIVVEERADIAQLVNAGCLGFHPWSATCQTADRPDLMLFDVDPTEIAFREVRNAALLLRELLGRYQLRSWVKTSGGRGLHVLVPLAATHSFEDVHAAASLIARAARTREPKLFTFEMRRSRRRGRILVDVERNRPGAALISPFSVKPDTGLVSTPLEWPDLERATYPEDFPVGSAESRVADIGAPLRQFFDHPQSLEPVLEAVQARERRRA
jgi:bifunctional non-homologous end joining protein LigD